MQAPCNENRDAKGGVTCAKCTQAMPELPEVETTRRGLVPHLEGREIVSVTLRRADLRFPIPHELPALLQGQTIANVARRAKYLLIEVARGSAILHLGMSGSLRIVDGTTPLKTHDHVDITLRGGAILRLNDPRRFGAFLWQPRGTTHPLLEGLGPEPLEPELSAEYLFTKSRGRKAPVKNFLMDQRIVVGVGNIYAAESLYGARIDPRRSASKVTKAQYAAWVIAVRSVLELALQSGGTTLRNFSGADSKPGYFSQKLQVYGRAGEACPSCGGALTGLVLGQRATVFCRRCQK